MFNKTHQAPRAGPFMFLILFHLSNMKARGRYMFAHLVDEGSKERGLLQVRQQERGRSETEAQVHQTPEPKFLHRYAPWLL